MNYNYLSNNERSHPLNQVPGRYQHPMQDRGMLQQSMYSEVQTISPANRVRFAMDACEQPTPGLAPSSSRGPPRPHFIHESPQVPYGMVPMSPHTPLTPLTPHSRQRYEYFGIPSPYISSVPEIPPFHTPGMGDFPEYHHAAALPARPQPAKRCTEVVKATKTTSTLKKQTPRYSFTATNNGKATTSHSGTKSEVTKAPPTPKLAPMTMKVLSGSVDKIIKWVRLTDAPNCLFEVTGTLVSLRTGMLLCQKILQLKEVAGPTLQCVFYEMDRPLPLLHQGQQIRCVGKMIARNKLQVFCVRAVLTTERSSLQRLGFICQRGLPPPKPVNVAALPGESSKVLAKN